MACRGTSAALCGARAGARRRRRRALAPRRSPDLHPLRLRPRRTPRAPCSQETLAQLDAYGIGQNLLPVPEIQADRRPQAHQDANAKMLPLLGRRDARLRRSPRRRIVRRRLFRRQGQGQVAEPRRPRRAGATCVAGVETVLALGAAGSRWTSSPTRPRRASSRCSKKSTRCSPAAASPGGSPWPRRRRAGRWSRALPATKSRALRRPGRPPLLRQRTQKRLRLRAVGPRRARATTPANTAAGTRIVPDLPSYGPNRWHDPAVENLATATRAVEEALARRQPCQRRRASSGGGASSTTKKAKAPTTARPTEKPG